MGRGGRGRGGRGAPAANDDGQPALPVDEVSAKKMRADPAQQAAVDDNMEVHKLVMKSIRIIKQHPLFAEVDAAPPNPIQKGKDCGYEALGLSLWSWLFWTSESRKAP
jgi:hypothetical protein